MSVQNAEYWPFPVVPAEHRTPQHHAEIAFLDDALREGFQPCKFMDGEYRIEGRNGRSAWVNYRGHARGRTATRWEIWLNAGNERVAAFWTNEFDRATTAALQWVRGGHVTEVIDSSPGTPFSSRVVPTLPRPKSPELEAAKLVGNAIRLAHYLPRATDEPLAETVYSADQLWLRISEIWHAYKRERDELITVTLGHANETLLHVSFGDGDWVLVHQTAPTSVYGAVGDPNATGKRWVSCPEWTLIERRYILSEVEGKRAILYWMTTGERDSRLQWEC
jgi:hypothetical protein